jgi:hypothetical protein
MEKQKYGNHDTGNPMNPEGIHTGISVFNQVFKAFR